MTEPESLFKTSLLNNEAAATSTDGIISYFGEVTPSFKESLKTGYAHLPWPQKEVLKASNFEIYAGGVQTDVPLRAGVGATAASDVFGRTLLNNKNAEYWQFFNKATIAEKVVPTAITDIAQQGGASSIIGSIPNGGTTAVPEGVSGYSVLHESSHGIDNVVRKMTGKGISESDDFAKAFHTDLTNLGGYNGAAEKGFLYYANPLDELSGKKELYAELSALKYANGANNDAFSQSGANTAAYVSKTNDGFEDAYAKDFDAIKKSGGEYKFDLFHPNMKNFIEQIHEPSPASSVKTGESLIENALPLPEAAHAPNLQGLKNVASSSKSTASALENAGKLGIAEDAGKLALKAAPSLEKAAPKLIRAGSESIPIVGAAVAGGFAAWEIGGTAYGAMNGQNTWGKVGTTAAANAAEIGGGVLGFGAGQAARQGVVEASKAAFGESNAPADSAVVSIGKDVYSALSTTDSSAVESTSTTGAARANLKVEQSDCSIAPATNTTKMELPKSVVSATSANNASHFPQMTLKI